MRSPGCRGITGRDERLRTFGRPSAVIPELASGFSTRSPWGTFAGVSDPQILSIQAESFRATATEFARELSEAGGKALHPARASWTKRPAGAALVGGRSRHGQASWPVL